MKRMRAAAICGAMLLLAGCAAEPGNQPAEESTGAPESAPATDPEEGQETAEAQSDPTFTVVSTGDVLIHDAIFEAAEQPGGGYDFAPGLAEVREWVSGADLALCSLEVPLAPPGVEPTGYPVFGAPEELVPGLAETGFDGCQTATNHALDRGTAGVQHTLDTFDAHGLGHVGTARSQAEAAAPQLYTLTRGGREITVAHLATTMLHNQSAPPPADAPWTVSDLSPEELSAAAAQARSDGADVVVASVHWGTEYVHEPTAEQRAYGEALAAAGEIDLVFGNHSHTPQPIEQLDGGPHDSGMWVVWSMGNFFTNQDEECCVPETATGTMVYATVEAPEDEPARVTGLEWSPVTVDREGPSRDNEVHRGIWPLAELATEGVPEAAQIDPEVVQQRWNRVREVVGAGSLRTEPPEPTGEEPEVIPRPRD